MGDHWSWTGKRDLPSVIARASDRAQAQWRPRPAITVASLILLAVSACGPAQGGNSLSPPATTSRTISLTTIESRSNPISTTIPSALDAARNDGNLDLEHDVAQVVGDIPPPGADQVVQGSVEYFTWIAECAELLGSSMIIATSPPAIFPKPGFTSRRDGEAVEACADAAADQTWFVRYPFDGSEESKSLEYRFQVEIYQCLVENDYPTVPPPSEGAFVSGDEQWNAYQAMGGSVLHVNPLINDEAPGSSEQLEAQQLCGASLATLYQEQVLQASP